ncbi:MAG: glycosyltransferase [Chthonomonadaceae bacterium]|nr:glycosyltransferase [Chthonomonadaceae bacterium]
MKNLHVVSSVDPATGGPVEGIRQISAVVLGQGHQVEVASLDDPSAEFLKDFPLPIHALGPGILDYAYSPKFLRWLRENHMRFDAVIVNGIWQYSSYAVWRALRHTDTPYFVYTHGMLDPWFNQTYPLKKIKKMLYWPWGMYGVLRDAKAVLFTTEEEKLLARQSFSPYKVNEVVVKYGTPGPSGDLQAMKASFLEKFPQLKDRRFLLYLSRIHEKKGCDLLIEAFAKIANDDNGLILVMAGPDKTNMAPALKERAAQLKIDDRIMWPGMLTGSNKWGAFASAEAFVLPSHQENFGIVVAEALACRTPVLISNKVNIWREVLAGEGGLVDDDTQVGTDRTLSKWESLSAQEREAFRDRARTCYETHFGIDAAAESLLAAVRKYGGVD